MYVPKGTRKKENMEICNNNKQVSKQQRDDKLVGQLNKAYNVVPKHSPGQSLFFFCLATIDHIGYGAYCAFSLAF